MGNCKPESQSLSLQVQETAQWARELSASCKEGSLGVGWAAGQTKSSQTSRAEPLAANAKGGVSQHGIEQHAGVWSLAVSAVV